MTQDYDPKQHPWWLKYLVGAIVIVVILIAMALAVNATTFLNATQCATDPISNETYCGNWTQTNNRSVLTCGGWMQAPNQRYEDPLTNTTVYLGIDCSLYNNTKIINDSIIVNRTINNTIYENHTIKLSKDQVIIYSGSRTVTPDAVFYSTDDQMLVFANTSCTQQAQAPIYDKATCLALQPVQDEINQVKFNCSLAINAAALNSSCALATPTPQPAAQDESNSFWIMAILVVAAVALLIYARNKSQAPGARVN